MHRFAAALAAAALALALIAAQRSAAIVYANITDIQVRTLSNSVQIIVKADGVLPWYSSNLEDGSTYASRVVINFPEAKNATGKNFINVAQFPVSHIQLSIPQGAQAGIGVRMELVLFRPSRITARRSDDQTSLIISVESPRTLVGAEAGPEGPTAVKRQLTVTVSPEGRLTIAAVRADIHELLSEISRQSNLDIAVDDAVRGEVTLFLVDVPPEQAFPLIAAAAGLALSDPEQTDGVYMFSQGIPEQLSAYRLSGTRSFPMANVEARTAAGLLPNFLYQYLQFNSQQNAVVVTAPRSMLEKIEQDLKAIDVPAPQLLIEALAVEFADSKDVARAFGVTYLNKTESTSFDSSAGTISFETTSQSPTRIMANIKALVARGKAKIWANPRMAVLNGEEAHIFIGQTRFIKVQITTFGGTSEEVRGVNVGVDLEVTPLTGGNDEITCEIRPKVSNISEIDPVTGLPVLSTREVSTSIRVKDGETIIIGGLINRQTSVSHKKIPILGDLPLIGQFFRSKDSSTTESELVVFVTPHILDEHGRLRDSALEEEIRRRFLGEEGALRLPLAEVRKRLAQITPGMSRDEVRRALGEPETISTLPVTAAPGAEEAPQARYEYWSYGPITVRFKDGKVQAVRDRGGAGEAGGK